MHSNIIYKKKNKIKIKGNKLMRESSTTFAVTKTRRNFAGELNYERKTIQGKKNKCMYFVLQVQVIIQVI